MLSFENDYNRGACPEILQRLREINDEPQTGYGMDGICRAAAEKIRAACLCPEAEVFFLEGGTQTNQVACAALLKSYEGVIAAETGHVSVHEAGAIEATGHKVITLPGHGGKLDAGELRGWLERFFADETREHMVFPGMVYLSYPSELGTLYSKAELTAVAAVCRDYGLPLYLDGARLACGLMSPESDLTLPELAALCDAFYIGGTKMGALFGEALVFPRGNAPAHMVTLIKQRGALLAKGWLLGLQFDVLFTDELYFRLGEHAIRQALRLRELLQEKGCALRGASPTNQQFVLLENERAERLIRQARAEVWERADEEHTVLRLCTSWATSDAELEELSALL